ncbi:uncharacterized protein LOC120690853 [Panicum virgatum]|uniref:uncharacterized protein LOC120690853 n=1 Tax=Panicum virgatum TaxID=38727 RepID=UPI0019D59716|nr:uncharacterized protein LOC120690853 [Panicum virgatum]
MGEPSIAPFPFGASTLAGASSEVVIAELHRLAIIFFPGIEVSPKFSQVLLPLLQGQGQTRAQASPRPLYSNLWHLTRVLAIAETEAPTQVEVETEPESVVDDTSLVNQGEPQQEPVFGYFYPVDGGADES